MGPNVRAILGLSIAATDRSWRARIHYTYLQRDEDRRLDSHGLVKSNDVEVSTIIFVNGVPFEQLVEHSGLPPSPRNKGNRRTSSARRKMDLRICGRSNEGFYAHTGAPTVPSTSSKGTV
jgi:hypothetical protein